MPRSPHRHRKIAKVEMRHIWRLVSWLSLGIAPFIVFNSAFGADLLALYHEAVDRDALYGAARAQYRADQEKLPQARAGLLPAVTLSGNTQYNDRDLQFRTAPANNTNAPYNSNTFNVTATQ